MNMLRGPHPLSFTFFFGEGSPFLALQNIANKHSPDRFVELLASNLTYLFLCPMWIVDLYLTDSFLLFVGVFHHTTLLAQKKGDFVQISKYHVIKHDDVDSHFGGYISFNIRHVCR